MTTNKWVGSAPCEWTNESINGELSFDERSHTDSQNLDDLIHWLEYANTGYPAVRQSVDQEEHWAKLLRNLICETLINDLVFFIDNTFIFRCSHCNTIVEGNITAEGMNVGIIKVPCEHIKDRFPDIIQHITYKFEESHT